MIRGRHTDSILFSLLLSATVVAGCFEPLNIGAAGGPADPVPDGGHTQSTTTPPIALDPHDPDQTTTRACDRTTQQATVILTDTCASCHGGRAPGENKGQPPFDFVLDFGRLVSTRSARVTDPADPSQGMRFVFPGDPDRSRVYAMVASTPPEMPPPSGSSPPLPMPTVSDMSILAAWIESCAGPPPVGGGADANPTPRDGGGN